SKPSGGGFAILRVPTDSPGPIAVISGGLAIGGHDATSSTFGGPIDLAPGTTLEFDVGGACPVTGDVSAAGAFVDVYDAGPITFSGAFRAGRVSAGGTPTTPTRFTGT